MDNYRWLYVDFNSYFASVEQQLAPKLRGQPIAVIPVESDATCAIAASYEAKAFGVKTGTPIYEAKKMCPKLICVLAKHDAYVHFHDKILEEIDRHIPVTKVCSIDEVACELMDNESSKERAQEIAHRIKEGLKLRVGEWIRCSIGIAPNRYLAKVATDMQKPDGLVFIGKEELPEKLHSLSLRDLPGIGQNMEVRLKKRGIYDMKTLCSLDLLQMRKAWGSNLGDRMWHHLRGIDLPDIETKRVSLGHSHVLAPDVRSIDKARQVALRLTLKCASRLRRMELAASLISLSLKTEEGIYYEQSARCPEASDSFTFTHLTAQMWDAILAKMGPIRIKKIGVTLMELGDLPRQQLSLFEEPKERKKAAKISVVLDEINHRYGKDSILLGILPNQGRSFSGTKIAFTRIPDQEEFVE
jgi:DNA polymerase-4